MRIVLIACLLGAEPTTASAEPARVEQGITPSGPAKAAVERWFISGYDVTCADAAGAEGTCDLGRALAFRTLHDAGGTDAMAFVLYSASVSNAVSLAGAQFRLSGEGWSLVRNVRGVVGEGPGALSFADGQATFSMKALMPGDARCCLTGSQRYEVDLAAGAVKAGPRMPSAAAAQAANGRFAPRPSGCRGASYTHNGSEVLVDELAGVIRYETPKPSIRKAVGKGTVLFRGGFGREGRVSGTAYVFKAGCEPAPYPVSGRSRGATIVLKGAAPRRDPNSCSVIAASAGGIHATLRFHEFAGDL